MGRLLTSAAAARLLGIGRSTLKRWAEDGRISYEQTAGGHWRFHEDAVRRLARALSGGVAWEHRLLRVLITAPDMHALSALLYEERSRSESWSAVANSVGRTLAGLGDCWARGDVSVHQEHRASAALAVALHTIAGTLTVGTARTCALASPPGEMHTLGLSMAALSAREAKWDVYWCGSMTPMRELCALVRSGTVQAVALSASSYMSDGARLAARTAAVRKECLRARLPLVVGGAGAWPRQGRSMVRLSDFRDFADHLTGRAQRGAPVKRRI